MPNILLVDTSGSAATIFGVERVETVGSSKLLYLCAKLLDVTYHCESLKTQIILYVMPRDELWQTVDLLNFPLSSVMLSFILLCNNFNISGVSPGLCFEMLILYFLCDFTITKKIQDIIWLCLHEVSFQFCINLLVTLDMVFL